MVEVILHGTSLGVGQTSIIQYLTLYLVATTWLMRAMFREISLVPLHGVQAAFLLVRL